MEDEIPEWARSCPSGKIKFASGEDARKITRESFKRNSRFKGTPRSYRCPECGSWHITANGRTNR